MQIFNYEYSCQIKILSFADHNLAVSYYASIFPGLPGFETHGKRSIGQRNRHQQKRNSQGRRDHFFQQC